MWRAAGRWALEAAGLEPTGAEAVLRGMLDRRTRAGRKLKLGPRIEFAGPRDRLQLGDDVTLWGNGYFNATGPRGNLRIGSGTHVDQFCVFYAQAGLTIGEGCAISSHVVIYTQTNQFRSAPHEPILSQPVVYAPVIIGDDVWIGAGCVVLPGVTVGDHAVLGAGAVVTKDVAPWSIAVGVPARVTGDRRSTQQAARSTS